MTEAERPVASRQALARAFTRIGYERKTLRTGRGPRGQQRFRETHCVVIPGAALVHEEDDRMVIALRSALGDRDTAMIRPVRIQEAYEAMGRKHGWRWTMSERQVSLWLGRNGFPLLPPEHGQVYRYVDRSRVDWISPPQP